MVLPIGELWYSSNPVAWDDALGRYWDFVQPCNRELERCLEQPGLVERVRRSNAEEWYQFLLNKYFRWKYTARNRCKTTMNKLKRYKEEGKLEELDAIRQSLLNMDRSDVEGALMVAHQIHGLGTAGASGLLALLYPHDFATVDQFVVKALQQIPRLPDAAQIAQMKPEHLCVRDGVLLIRVMKQKANENNEAFATSTWTPRKVDKVLWAYGRPSNTGSCSGTARP